MLGKAHARNYNSRPRKGAQIDQAVTYSVRDVERLIGLHDDRSKTGTRHLTVADLLSWSRDPGGIQIRWPWDPEFWMAKRGPIEPDSEAACILWDFERAMTTLSARDRAVIALAAMQFDYDEIADALRISKKYVSTYLRGRKTFDEDGQPCKDVWGRLERAGGAVHRLADAMNGGVREAV